MGIRRIPSWISAILLSLILHSLLFTGASILYVGNSRAGEIQPLPLAVRISPQQGLPPARSREPVAEPVPGVESEAGAESAQNLPISDPPGENTHRKEPSSRRDAAGIDPVPAWKIDVPPVMTESGTLGADPDIIALLDALPVTAAVYLNSDGNPYLVLYNPDPPEEVRSLLNRFFTSARFSPAMAGDLYVPSVLLLPLEIKGLEPG